MSPKTQIQVAHESETQRQHVRLMLSGSGVLQGKSFALRNLSAAGCALDGVAGAYKPGDMIRIDLTLPFNGFSMSAPFEAEVRHYNIGSQLLGCRFVNGGAQQTSFLHYILKSFVAGEVVSAGGLLNVVARNNFTKPRPPANVNAVPSLRRQLPGLVVVAALGILILMFLAQNLYNSLFIVRSREAVVAGPVTSLRSPVAGIVDFKADSTLAIVKLGQVIGTVTPWNGAPVNLASPCNCYVTNISVTEGEALAAGDRILSLAPVNSKPWLIAETEPAAAMKIKTSAPVRINISGSTVKYTGRVASIESNLANSARQGGTVVVKIIPDQPLPVDFINRLAVVTFSTH